MPKIGNCKYLGHLIFQGRLQYAEMITIDMCLLIEIRHNILTQSHGNCMKVENYNHMLEIDILRNDTKIFLGVPRRDL